MVYWIEVVVSSVHLLDMKSNSIIIGSQYCYTLFFLHVHSQPPMELKGQIRARGGGQRGRSWSRCSFPLSADETYLQLSNVAIKVTK